MATKQLVTKVWIAPGCIVCDACETTCPDVFDVQETTCLIRPEALNVEFTKARTETIIEAAEECPVEVIKFETVEVDQADAPAPVTAPAAAPAALAAAGAAAPAAAAGTAPPAAAAPAAATHADKPPAVVDPAIAALLKATTSRGGKAGMGKGGSESAPAVKALRARKLDELPPDARFEKVLEATKAQKAEAQVTRREVVAAAIVGWGSFTAAAAAGGLAMQRFMFPNVLEEPDPKVRLGDLSKYLEMPIGSVNEDFKPQGIWIVRLEGEVAALSTTCTHLGCIPNWQEAERKFKCPCHGSGFMQTGVNFEGPAPRPLERFQIGLEDGVVVVNRAKKFQQEKGEWSNPDSFISV
jgi:cytochrome b6-f complex iron-sulfur subunit